jgi:Domain of unknown function (DUF4214)/Glycosyltransferase family 9 (heptosyltransferase)
MKIPRHLPRFSAERTVSAVYVALLGRAPDEAGREAYAEQLSRTGDLTGLLTSILDSDEFLHRYSSLNSDLLWRQSLSQRAEQFVAEIYRSLLAREPDEAASGFVGQFRDSGRIAPVLSAIGASEELHRRVWAEQVEQHRRIQTSTASSMDILIGRHNGIGDLIMAVPLIGHLLDRGHNVTMMTRERNHDFLRWIFPKLLTTPHDVQPEMDWRSSVPGFDKYLNFNRVIELTDDQTCLRNGLPMNQQEVYCLLVISQMGGLENIPANLSPSRWIKQVYDKSGPTMVFTRSTHPSRRIEAPVLEQLLKRYPDAVIDPQYETQIQFAEAVARARLVIAPDSGAIHVAELVSTPWICLHTVMDHSMRHLFYEHGRSIQSSVACSPCRRHGGCGNIQCTSNFNLDLLDQN